MEKNWQRTNIDGIIHICPMNDFRLHFQTDCWCEPFITENCEVVHNSADQRELYEQGIRKPN